MTYRFARTCGVILAFASLPLNCMAARPDAGPITGERGAARPGAPEMSNRPIDDRLMPAYTRFGFNLLSRILASDAGKNVFISPASVALALGMTYNGASGETRQAMAKALGYSGMSLEEVNRANEALLASLAKADANVQLQIANSLWAREGVAFRPDFIARNREFYRAEMAALDFSSPKAADRINAWVGKNTNGRIKQIVAPPIKPEMVLFLINAVYFKGQWTRPFEKGQTRDREFTLGDGSKKQTPMMEQAGKYQYVETPEFQAVRLPYGKSERFSMLVALPARHSSLKAFTGNLTPENWREWTGQMSRTEGMIVLPRFRMEYEKTLNDALKALDMAVAFDDRADFAAMSPEDLFISEVKHKTFVEVNEEGTEAAAVTSVGMALTSMPVEPPKRFEMIVDRPFFFAIQDTTTGLVLFMGMIADPRQ